MSRIAINKCARHGVPVMGNVRQALCALCKQELEEEQFTAIGREVVRNILDRKEEERKVITE